MTNRFDAAIDLIDRVNAADPHTLLVDGQPTPKELAYSRHMTRWLQRLSPDAGEALRLAARAQHIARWEIPRSTYPMDRPGYLKWRTSLYFHHARRAAEILQAAGYDPPTIERVARLLRKEQIKTDPEMQTLEDVVCLVFLETELPDFLTRHTDQKLLGILRKTWGKMSQRGHQAALELLPQLPPRAQSLLQQALAPQQPQ